jgi:hypothetical protein
MFANLGLAVHGCITAFALGVAVVWGASKIVRTQDISMQLTADQAGLASAVIGVTAILTWVGCFLLGAPLPLEALLNQIADKNAAIETAALPISIP